MTPQEQQEYKDAIKILRVWLMDYPADTVDEEINKLITEAPPLKIVNAVIIACDEWKQKALKGS